MTNKSRNTDKLSLEHRLKDFHKRWNIEISEQERWDNFKNRVLNALESILSFEFVYNDESDNEFLHMIGIHAQLSSIERSKMNFIGKEIQDCFSYKYFLRETDMKRFLLGIETISWMETIETERKNRFLSTIADIIKITNVPIELKYSKNEFLIYPLGAKLLDEKLINDPLDWLDEYPKSYDLFKLSLQDLGVPGKERQIIDNLRLSLELLFKSKLGNSKS